MRTRTTLHSVDPDANRYRFYIVELWLPPVGTGAALRKRWGRIGTEGRSEVDYFDTAEGAQHYADVLIRRRLQRGYTEVRTESEPWRALELEAEMEARLHRLRSKLRRVREQMGDESAARRESRSQLVLFETG